MPKATQLLRQDHKRVEGLFNKCEKAKGLESKKRYAAQAIQELEVHAQLEEEIFYPAVRKGVGLNDLVREARQEHKQAKSLMAQLKKLQGQENGAAEKFEQKFSELIEAVQQHVQEEEGEMFPKLEDGQIDLAELGSEMAERKKELMKQTAKTRPASKPRSKTKSKSSRSTR